MKPHEKERLQKIADEIVQTIIKKDEAYGSSWKSHGGYSAFFNLDRKYIRGDSGASPIQDHLVKASIELEGGRDSLEDLIAYALLTLMETSETEGEPGPEYVDQDREG